MVSLMQNEGETDSKKAMIMVSFDDFRTASESRIFIFWLFHQFTHNSTLTRYVASFIELAN